MYKITKFINDTQTVSLVFDYVDQAQEIFNDLRYDEFVRFKRLYGNGIKKEIREEKIDSDIVYREYKFSVPTFNVTIVLTYVKD